jgi:hypothetical protein
LPATTGLYGTYGNTRDIVVLYSCHLTAVAGLNGILWLLAGLPRGQPSVAAGMALTTTVFVVATLFALIAPQTYIAQWLWGWPLLRRQLSKDFWQGAGEVEQMDEFGRCPSRVKMRNTLPEYLPFVLPPNSDIARRGRHIAFVPKSDIDLIMI